ncbi:hypothetical protein CTI12_AA145760 [Artemisia annua]|uniref:Aminoacyl-tRNA synthetase class II (D/K/N) domain-containing protein n=1 Tax=Artemisia annua TaxID=35608 RepID=A0A2U1MUR8_ARTAN|nr:hypothetical protein CTI12_AA145760 [Artemisia annua]
MEEKDDDAMLEQYTTNETSNEVPTKKRVNKPVSAYFLTQDFAFGLWVGKSDSSCPIQKKMTSNEFLRSKAHLRPRTNTFGAEARVRNALAYATHQFFQENGFVCVASPIITASDCEGAGEQFCVTTLIPTSKEATDSSADAIPRTENGSIDWSQNFFGKPAFLTVLGQLNGETYATDVSDVLLP